MGNHKLTGLDYLDLYKFFQNRADTLKASMFGTATWIIGFAVGLLVFVFATLTEYKDSTLVVLHQELGIICCGGGVLLCIYALIVLSITADHINGNWERSKFCEGQIDGIVAVIKSYQSNRVFSFLNRPWYVVGLIVVALMIIFIATGIQIYEYQAVPQAMEKVKPS